MTERFAWIDLAAGPFAWGPSVGGEGVRTHSSLPDFSAAWQGPSEDLGLGRLGGSGGKGGGQGGEGGEGGELWQELEADLEAGPSVVELEAERAVLYEVTLGLGLGVTQRTCDDEGSNPDPNPYP